MDEIDRHGLIRFFDRVSKGHVDGAVREEAASASASLKGKEIPVKVSDALFQVLSEACGIKGIYLFLRMRDDSIFKDGQGTEAMKVAGDNAFALFTLIEDGMTLESGQAKRLLSGMIALSRIRDQGPTSSPEKNRAVDMTMGVLEIIMARLSKSLSLQDYRIAIGMMDDRRKLEAISNWMEGNPITKEAADALGGVLTGIMQAEGGIGAHRIQANALRRRLYEERKSVRPHLLLPDSQAGAPVSKKPLGR